MFPVESRKWILIRNLLRSFAILFIEHTVIFSIRGVEWVKIIWNESSFRRSSETCQKRKLFIYEQMHTFQQKFYLQCMKCSNKIGEWRRKEMLSIFGELTWKWLSFHIKCSSRRFFFSNPQNLSSKGARDVLPLGVGQTSSDMCGDWQVSVPSCITPHLHNIYAKHPIFLLLQSRPRLTVVCRLPACTSGISIFDQILFFVMCWWWYIGIF